MARMRVMFHRPVQLALLLLSACVPRGNAPQVVPIPNLAPIARDDDAMRRALLYAHAAARAGVGLPALRWDAGLAAEARAYASWLARTGRFEHAGQEAEGENLWAGTRGAYRFEEMAGHWAEERRLYRGWPIGAAASRTGRFEDVGHYTQMVWRETRSVGCGLASNAREDVLVCRYWPRGNWIDEMAY